jgi:hypothetical protein
MSAQVAETSAGWRDNTFLTAFLPRASSIRLITEFSSIGLSLPRLNISYPKGWRHLIVPSAISSIYEKSLCCLPSPKTVIGIPVSMFFIKIKILMSGLPAGP